MVVHLQLHINYKYNMKLKEFETKLKTPPKIGYNYFSLSKF